MSIYSGPNPKDINSSYPDHTDDYIVCLEDGSLKKKIEKGYLKKFGLTREQYLEKYPGAPLCSNNASKKYKDIASSPEERLKRSNRMKELNFQKDFQKLRKTGVSKFWASDSSEEIRKKLSDNAKKQHQNGLSDHIREVYFRSKYMGSEDQLNRRLRLLNENSPLKSTEVRQKRFKTMRERYGVINPSQIGIDRNIIDILEDENQFKLIIKDKSIKEISMNFGVSEATIKTYLRRYDFFNLVNTYYSNLEFEIADFLRKNNISFKTKDRTLIAPKEIDFYIPEYQLGIEVHGLYYHSEIKLNEKDYHYYKYLMCKKKGITLFQIFQNELEDENIKKIWFSRILYYLQCNNKTIYARKCSLKVITSDEYKSFLTLNHVQGVCNSSIKIGLFYQNEMVSVIGLSKKTNNILNIDRYCSSLGINVVGAFSKFIAFVERNYDYSYLITFSDNRYSNGLLYEKSGFVKDKELKPDYYYTDFSSLFHKFNFRKTLLSSRFDIDISNKTEHELTKELGFFRIYDAGKIRWKKSKSSS